MKVTEYLLIKVHILIILEMYVSQRKVVVAYFYSFIFYYTNNYHK